MLSGFQVLGSFDQALLQAQQQAASIDRRLGDLNDRLLQLRNEEGQAYRTLARVRLSAPKTDQLLQRLASVDGNVRTALQQRTSATAEIDAEITTIEAEAQALQADRKTATGLVEERRQALLAAEEATRRRLEEEPAYRQQAQATRRAEEIARSAEEKTRQAESDRIAKGQPYERDALFQYLWERGFATPAYTAGPFTRMMDRWVARIVGYDKARRDYAMLQEIPRRLADHASRQREQAQAERKRLADMQRAALKEGEPAARRAELVEAEAKVDAIDDKIEANGKRAIEAYQRRAAITRGEHPAIRKATDVVEQALRNEELQELRAAARQTPTRDDDAAVRRLEQLEAEEGQLRAAIEQAKADQQTYRKQMSEIDLIRRDYRRRGYNRGMFDVAGGALIGSLLGQLLGGAIGRDVFWDRMNQHRLPDSGGWGGGFGDSDFGTGGGFGGGEGGGGDFRTGGGF